jgi:hypothetical protein
MCMIGTLVGMKDVPRSRAIKAVRTLRSSHSTWRAPNFGEKYKKGWTYVADALPTGRGYRGESGFWVYRGLKSGAKKCRADHRRARQIIVKVWGRVAEHKYGFRAQFMKRVA